MKRTKLPLDRAVGTSPQKSLPKLRWTTLAVAAALTFGLASPDALALALGRVTVQSALGEPLRAEIDLPEISPEEVASLKANIASPAQFRAAGVEFSPALNDVQITLQRRTNGSYFLRLASDRPVNDPFVDVILEATWSSGRVQRDFTMLLDPPSLRQQQAGQQPLSPQAAAPSTPAARPAPTPRTTPGAAPVPAPSTRAAAPAAPATPRAPARAAASAPSGEAGKRVTVQAGDTAGKLAAASKPATVSLDQMLVALLRANPDAFVDGNVNRLRAGAVLEMPGADAAAAVPQEEAHRNLVAQSRDFNEFRRRLAEGVPTAAAPSASRQAAGRVQAEVEDRKAPAGPGDRLTLSKGAVQGRTGKADQIARQRQSQEEAARVAELNKNLSDLNKLAGATPGAAGGTGTRPAAGISAPPGVSPAQRGASAPAAANAPAAAGRAAPAPATPPAAAGRAAPATTGTPAPATTAGRPASAPGGVNPPAAATAARPASAPTTTAAATTTAPAATTTTPGTTTAPGAPATTAATPATGGASAPKAAASGPIAGAAPGASAPVAAAKPPVRRPAPPPPPEPSLVDDLLENPLVPALVVGLLAVLAGFGFYKFRQKRKTAAVDSSFLESRLQPDSFFGASGGQRIDTAEANNPTGSSMVYSPSQLDAAGDVDPVAEADVYLAYGRDLQAEEILKEALRINPQRVAIHAKLLEIYAKRRDVKAFESVAAEAYNLTQGTGPEWEHICELGRELEPANPLYRPGGQPGVGAAAAAGAAVAAAAVAAPSFAAAHPPAAQPAAAPDVDLDLDFSLGDDEPETLQPVAAAPFVQPEPPIAAAEPEPLHMDFDAPLLPPQVEPVRVEAPPLVDDNSLDFTPPPLPTAAPAAAPAPAAALDSGMLEFDLGGLSLDLPGTNAPVTASPTAVTPVPPPPADLDMPPLAFDLDQPSTQGPDLSTPGGADADSPLATKLALAEEFNAIGDADGARSLAEEVLAEASGDLKSRAQRLLAEIG
jgi:pilus assembly protein FimV